MREYYLSLIHGDRKGWDAVIVGALLRLISWGYTGIVGGLRWAYQNNILHSYHLGRPVISVGNITWGGSGKTPLVQWIARELLSDEKHPVILTRGYMPGQKSEQISDESLVLQESFQGKVPVIANKDRVQGALSVPQHYPPDVFILDDGFQHWRVQRELDIVLVDAMNPFGNGAVLPRGILREPLRALSHADVIVVTRVNFGTQDNIEKIYEVAARYCPEAGVVEAIHHPTELSALRNGSPVEISALKAQPVILVSGIGNPGGFEKTVESLGADLKHHCMFGDHHAYTLGSIEQILYQAESHQASYIVVTSKDAVKLKPFSDHFPEAIRVLVLSIEMSIIKGEEVLRHAVHSICGH